MSKYISFDIILKYACTPVFTITFIIRGHFFIVLLIWLKDCRSNVFFFFFRRQNVRSRKIGCVSEVLHARTHLIGIGWAICSDLSGGWDLTKYGKLETWLHITGTIKSSWATLPKYLTMNRLFKTVPMKYSFDFNNAWKRHSFYIGVKFGCTNISS